MLVGLKRREKELNNVLPLIVRGLYIINIYDWSNSDLVSMKLKEILVNEKVLQ